MRHSGHASEGVHGGPVGLTLVQGFLACPRGRTLAVHLASTPPVVALHRWPQRAFRNALRLPSPDLWGWGPAVGDPAPTDDRTAALGPVRRGNPAGAGLLARIPAGPPRRGRAYDLDLTAQGRRLARVLDGPTPELLALGRALAAALPPDAG